MILRSRVILPVSGPPVENGFIRVVGDRISNVGRWQEADLGTADQVLDLGDVMLLPGFINAHCHLDYTLMAGKIQPFKTFTSWIKAIVAMKAGWSYTEFAQSWLEGAKMLLKTGTTTVADVEAVPEILPDVWDGTPLRVISFREMINLKPQPRAEELVDRAVTYWASFPQAEGRVGLSPHAPYTTSRSLLQSAARQARARTWPLTTHLAESEEEFQMFMYGSGPLHEWLKFQRDMSDCGRGSPVAHLERCGYLSESLLAVHVNYLDRNDAEILGCRKVSVVHCPSSHAFFKHIRFPREELAAAGVNLCLGTDSLASTLKTGSRAPKLNMFSEMQLLAKATPGLSPASILNLATLNGARALGRTKELGELSPGAIADVIALPYLGDAAEAPETAVHFQGEVAASMINGRWAISPESLLHQTP
jgi:aminodeoxyfutalosine deaminase